MARVIGYVKSLEQGTFFVKDAKGSVRQLKVGEAIHEGELVYGAPTNPKNAKIIVDITLEGMGDLVIAGNGALNFDTSLLKGVFAHDDAVVYLDSIKDVLAFNALNANVDNITEAGDETAAGDAVTDTERPGSDIFFDRTGLVGDVATVLNTIGGNPPDVTSDTTAVVRPVVLEEVSSIPEIPITPEIPDEPEVPVIPETPSTPPSTPASDGYDLLPSVSVDLDISDLGAVTLSGTSTNATSISVVISGTDGSSQNAAATLNANGSWSVDTSSLSFTEEVTYTATATATDGTNSATASDSDGYDLAYIENGQANLTDTATLDNGISEMSGTIAINGNGTEVLTTQIDLNTLPTTLTSGGGDSITWSYGLTHAIAEGKADSETVMRVTLNNGVTEVPAGSENVSYTVELLNAVDHLIENVKDTLSFDVGITLSDGTHTDDGMISVNIEDDIPVAHDTSSKIQIFNDDISINDLKAGFINDIYLNGTATVEKINNDTDSYNDIIQWGSTNGTQSGYELKDNTQYTSNTGSSIVVGETIKLADFTHNNYPISADSSTLDKTDMTMTMDIVVNGTSTPITFNVTLDHTETSNSGIDPRDIITLPEQTVKITIDQQNYEIKLEGFKDSNGNIVNEIKTDENASNDFGIYGTISTIKAYPTLDGTLNYEPGADGGKITSIALNGNNYDSDTSDILTELGGSLTVDMTTGDYTYDPANKQYGRTYTEDVSYTVTDGDGDSATANLTIDLSAMLADKPMVDYDATTTVIANEAGIESIDADLGMGVGKDTAGASVQITDASHNSLINQTVTAQVKDNSGVLQTINVTSGGTALKYIADSSVSGGLIAVKTSDNSEVFKVNADVLKGTYSMIMIDALDEVTSYTKSVDDSVNLTLANVNGTVQASGEGVSIGTSAFIDTDGDKVKDIGETTVANVTIDADGVGIDNTNTSGDDDNSAQITNDSDTGHCDSGTDGGGERLVLNIGKDAGITIRSVDLAFNNLNDNDYVTFTATGNGTTVPTDFRGNSTDTKTITGDVTSISLGAGQGDNYQLDEQITVNYTKTESVNVDNPELIFTFGATVTDGDGQSAQTTFDVIVDSDGVLDGTAGKDQIVGGSEAEMINGLGGEDIITAGVGNDTIIYDAADTVIDGEEGVDILVLPTNSNIDFSRLVTENNPIDNIEVIDLSVNGVNTLENLSIQDVVDMTDSSNELTILGDSNDSVDIDAPDSVSITTGAESVTGDNNAVNVYTTTDPTVTVQVEETVTQTI